MQLFRVKEEAGVVVGPSVLRLHQRDGRLVSVFGDWQSDPELKRCRPMLAELFAPLDQDTGAADEPDDASFQSSFSGSFKYGAIAKKQLQAPPAQGGLAGRRGSNARRGSVGGRRGSITRTSRESDGGYAAAPGASEADSEVDGEIFLDVIRKLRPLGKDEKDGDDELMALSEEFVSGGDASFTRAYRERMPGWMANMAQRARG